MLRRYLFFVFGYCKRMFFQGRGGWYLSLVGGSSRLVYLMVTFLSMGLCVNGPRFGPRFGFYVGVGVGV